MAQAKAKNPHLVYQLLINLEGSEPAVWRRVEVPDCSLMQLNDAVQIAMGWEGEHLWEFVIDKQRYCPAQDSGASFMDEGQHASPLEEVWLSDVIKGRGKKFLYHYDFGDDWRHVLTVEQIAAPESAVTHPRCLGGERACPPEDCGGIWGYQHLLHLLSHPDEDDEGQLEWLGKYKPGVFPMQRVNRQLAKFRIRPHSKTASQT